MTIVEDRSQRSRDALTAAQLYYQQDLTMEAIARELHTSRSTISRLLAYAREAGLVTIQVASTSDLPRQLERDIWLRYRVATHVVPVPDAVSDVHRLDRVGRSAARIIANFVDSNMVIGVAWGATMTAMSRHLVRKPTRDTTVVQLNGAANPRTTGLVYASELLQRFGDAFDARVQQFPVPALFDDPATREAMWRERSVRRVLDIQRSMNLTVFGVGSPFARVPSHVYVGGYLEDRDLEEMQAQRVVGDVATRFYRADGSSDGIGINTRSSGPEFEVQRRVPQRVCIVSGTSKLQSLRGALAAGLITDLILDESVGQAILQP